MDDPATGFRSLRLRGGRFDAAATDRVGFPLEAITELARYERLLIRVARELWLTDNRSRVRAPKGFDERLRLRLTAVERGCVAPVLALQNPADDALFSEAELLERSQQAIADALAAVVAEEPLPASFPPAAASWLVPFGSGLRADESCVLERPSGSDVVYTQEGRRHLVRIVSAEDIKIDGQLVGRVGAVDANRQAFDFTGRAGSRIEGSFEQTGMFRELREHTERDAVAPYVRISCRYSTNDAGQLSRIEDVYEIELVVGPADPLGPQLRKLLELGDGWNGEHSRAPSVAAVEWARDFAAELRSDELSPFAICPTHAGGVLIERQNEVGRWSLDIEPDGSAVAITVPLAGEPAMREVDEPAAASDDLRRFGA